MTEAELKKLIGRWAKAQSEGGMCECAEPDLRGEALACFTCLKRHPAQVARWEANFAKPHAFEKRDGMAGTLGWCGKLMPDGVLYCNRNADHPVHQLEARDD